MGHAFWFAASAVAAMAILGLGRSGFPGAAVSASPESRAGYAEAMIGQPETFEVGVSGSALAMAAFGMSALQPETYDSDLVLGIIHASPLAEAEKVQLARDLEAAEAGQAELGLVLADVRIALAVD